jgi:hypothetical protein
MSVPMRSVLGSGVYGPELLRAWAVYVAVAVGVRPRPPHVVVRASTVRGCYYGYVRVYRGRPMKAQVRQVKRALVLASGISGPEASAF